MSQAKLLLVYILIAICIRQASSASSRHRFSIRQSHQANDPQPSALKLRDIKLSIESNDDYSKDLVGQCKGYACEKAKLFSAFFDNWQSQTPAGMLMLVLVIFFFIYTQ